MDTIVGKRGKGVIVTLVERSTDYMMMKRLPKGKNAKALAKTVKYMLAPYKNKILTITTDNGTEFAEHKKISKYLNTKVFFTDPYSSWQKGNIENTNNLSDNIFQKTWSLANLITNIYGKYNIKLIDDHGKNLISMHPRFAFSKIFPKLHLHVESTIYYF